MALQMFLGFDDTIAETQLTTVGGSSSVTGRSGRGLAHRYSASAAVRTVILPTALSTGFFGMALRWNTGFTAGRQLLLIAPDGSTIHCGVGVDATGHITLYGPANTVIATSTVVVSPTVWNFYEVKVVISDTVGILEVRQDETVIVTFSGDTRNGAATTVAFMDIAGAAGVNSIDIDDLWVDDAAYLGDKTVEKLDPSNNGSSSGWLGSDANSVDNYLLVDDPTTSNMTDYVGASASGTLDLYAMSDLPAGYSVDAVQEVIYVQKSDAGTPPTLLPVAKGALGTTRTDTALPALSTTAQLLVGQLRTTDPDGNPLSAARVNGMEVGLKIL